jgi:hypothetical protein
VCDLINRYKAKLLEKTCCVISETALEAALQVGLRVVNHSWLCSAWISDRPPFVGSRTYEFDMAS